MGVIIPSLQVREQRLREMKPLAPGCSSELRFQGIQIKASYQPHIIKFPQPVSFKGGDLNQGLPDSKSAIAIQLIPPAGSLGKLLSPGASSPVCGGVAHSIMGLKLAGLLEMFYT